MSQQTVSIQRMNDVTVDNVPMQDFIEAIKNTARKDGSMVINGVQYDSGTVTFPSNSPGSQSLVKLGEINFADLNAGPFAGATIFSNAIPANKYERNMFLKTLEAFSSNSGVIISAGSFAFNPPALSFNAAGVQETYDTVGQPMGLSIPQDIVVSLSFVPANAKDWTAGRLGAYIILSDFPVLN